jgi:hypothetical protein
MSFDPRQLNALAVGGRAQRAVAQLQNNTRSRRWAFQTQASVGSAASRQIAVGWSRRLSSFLGRPRTRSSAARHKPDTRSLGVTPVSLGGRAFLELERMSLLMLVLAVGLVLTAFAALALFAVRA